AAHDRSEPRDRRIELRLRIDRAERRREIESRGKLSERPARVSEELATHAGLKAGQALRDVQEAALGSARGLVPQLRIANLRALHEHSDLLGDHVRIESLKIKRCHSKNLRFTSPVRAGGFSNDSWIPERPCLRAQKCSASASARSVSWHALVSSA